MDLDFMQSLPTLAEANAQPIAIPASVLRIEYKRQREREDIRKLSIWRKAIWLRDEGLCRACGCEVKKTQEPHPQRGECNHIAGRRDRAVRWDVRNGVLLCMACHRLVTGTVGVKVTIRQDEHYWFYVGRQSYIDATYDNLQFIRNAKETA